MWDVVVTVRSSMNPLKGDKNLPVNMETRQIFMLMFIVYLCLYQCKYPAAANPIPTRSTADMRTTKFVTREDYFTGEVTNCGWVQCFKGTYVEKCVKNFTMDSCQPCPNGTYLRDDTDSDHVFGCRSLMNCTKADHTIDSEEYHTCAAGGLRKCQCDTDNGYCGDPCDCSKKSCQPGEVLLKICTCVKKPQTFPPTPTEKDVTTVPVPVENLTTENNKEAAMKVTSLTLSTTSTTFKGPHSTLADGCKQMAPVNDNLISMSVGSFIGVLIATIVITVILMGIGVVIYCKQDKVHTCIGDRIDNLRKRFFGYNSPSQQNE